MALANFAEANTLFLSAAVGSVVVVSSLLFYLFWKPSFPKNAPPLTTDSLPIVGSLGFFTRRWDFFRESSLRSKTGNFSFYAGQWPVVGLSNHEAKLFFDHRGLGFSEGYTTLLAGAPKASTHMAQESDDAHSTGSTADFGKYFSNRLIALMKGPALKQGFPTLLSDARAGFEALGQSGVTNPFDSIYRLVFQFTMRTVACREIAEDPALVSKALSAFESLEEAASPWMIMFPWLPLLSKIRRTYAGAQLFFMFKKVVDDRKAHSTREQDALQFLLDKGDSVQDILTFVLGALFAGQLNSGIHAAYILCHLALSPEWLNRTRQEVYEIADKYCPDKSAPLKDRLMKIPFEAWEEDFPIIDLCLRETIRIQLPGTTFRQNVTGNDIPLSTGEVIPRDAFVAFHVAEIHSNPEIYTDHEDWDPARYLPERAEDKKQKYGFVGWGVGRHPCLGMRFAKLENVIIVAMFIAYFNEFSVSDSQGNPVKSLPPREINNLSARKPRDPIYIKYKSVA